MLLEFHPLIASDIARIMKYYEDVSGPELGSEFTATDRFFREQLKSPKAYASFERDLRRVILERFPYHFLFRIVGERVRILVVRHHKRRPSLGFRRR